MPLSERTTLPRATRFNATVLFNRAGQLTTSSPLRPRIRCAWAANRTPSLLMFTVLPTPVASFDLRCHTFYRISRSIGNLADARRSALSLAHLGFHPSLFRSAVLSVESP